ncbi:GNAT family N-acetyltransferase [Arthrobacter sp. GMC3]|uniref:GNAT family N-acetyltransferase n=1 Tax=Arthrobacter sp. GMC3 TaxID=2058894 RepID=UPI000CE3B59C|nr:GNAT family N-acetyltransferase [Arthrobacter sp. GMC3]
MSCETQTRRLHLRAIRIGDGELLFPIFSDHRLWWYEPSSRHINLRQTDTYVERAAGRWNSDGFSYWIAFLVEDPSVVVGSGGVQRHRSGSWNLNYRIEHSLQRQGYATELAMAGIAAAHSVDPTSPVIAWIDPLNAPSRATALKAGLFFAGMRVDSSDGRKRAAYVDRKLPDASAD